MGWNMFGTPEQDSRYRYSRLIAKHLQFTDCEMFKSIRIITITTHSIRKSYIFKKNAIVARGKKRNIYPCLAHVTSNNYELINTSVYYYHNRLINHRRTSKGCHRLLIQNFIFFLRTLHQSANFCFRGWFSRMINSRSELHASHIAFVCKSFLEWGARVYW